MSSDTLTLFAIIIAAAPAFMSSGARFSAAFAACIVILPFLSSEVLDKHSDSYAEAIGHAVAVYVIAAAFLFACGLRILIFLLQSSRETDDQTGRAPSVEYDEQPRAIPYPDRLWFLILVLAIAGAVFTNVWHKFSEHQQIQDRVRELRADVEAQIERQNADKAAQDAVKPTVVHETAPPTAFPTPPTKEAPKAPAPIFDR